MPFGHTLGFTHLPLEYYPILVAMVVAYLVLVEQAKGVFYRRRPIGAPIAVRRSRHERRVHRRAARFSRPRSPARDTRFDRRPATREEASCSTIERAPLSDHELARIDAYWRAANYLTVGQIYLLDNALLQRRARSRPT